MSSIPFAANEPQKPNTPATPVSTPQQTQGDPKPSTDKPAVQQK